MSSGEIDGEQPGPKRLFLFCKKQINLFLFFLYFFFPGGIDGEEPGPGAWMDVSEALTAVLLCPKYLLLPQ